MLAHMASCSKDMAWGRESINGFAVKPHDLKLELREAFQKVFSMANIKLQEKKHHELWVFL